MARTRATHPAPADDGADGRPAPTGDAAGYTVVARRYRPQRFEDVVGQDHVVQALRNAIRLNRVTHAYLFSGTRGVGKTSMARIFAKCLNCARGPTDEPCNECDICRAISVGQDVDVIEIDGASNNGVEAVRELRQNAGLRPSRARFKIYYIDEVHMLSTGAFNALLKTLEEPPEHVKFFFATTEPNKIPITVLSRCQRYDFAGITPDQIVASLAEICGREGVAAEPDALAVVARRAAGSMRDAQSLLEQLLSYGEANLTAEAVHRALGIAPDERILDLVDALADHDVGRALGLLDGAVGSGVQPADVLAGLLEFLRDVMVVSAGAGVAALAAAPSQRPRLEAVAARWPLDTILAALQVLSEARGRLRGSPHGRLVVELALARVARLEELAPLGDLIGRLEALDGAAPPVKKKPPLSVGNGPAPRAGDAEKSPHPLPGGEGTGFAPSPPSAGERAGLRRPSAPPSPPEDGPDGPLDLDAVLRLWPGVVRDLGAPLGTQLDRIRPTAFEPPAAVVVAVPPNYTWVADACERPDARARIEAALRARAGRTLALRFDRPASPAAAEVPPPPRIDELGAEPLVQKVVQLFEARPQKIEYDE